jgi:hypothetical protein
MAPCWPALLAGLRAGRELAGGVRRPNQGGFRNVGQAYPSGQPQGGVMSIFLIDIFIVIPQNGGIGGSSVDEQFLHTIG